MDINIAIVTLAILRGNSDKGEVLIIAQSTETIIERSTLRVLSRSSHLVIRISGNQEDNIDAARQSLVKSFDDIRSTDGLIFKLDRVPDCLDRL